MNAPLQIVPIFSGGGTRLPCFVGILQALGELGIGWRHLVGVSGGGVVASLAAAGWSHADLLRLALETDFSRFRGFSALSLLRTGGLSSGDRFERWMDEQLRGATFADLPHELHIVATDINGGGPVLFNRRNSPAMRVSQAVRYSMSIPLLFAFKTFEGRVMTDGVILSEDALHRDWAGDGTPAVCFRLRGGTAQRQGLKVNRWIPALTYINLLVQTFMNAVSREYVRADHWHSTLIVDTGEVSPVDFSLSPQTKAELHQAGYLATRDFLPPKLARSLCA